MVMTATSDRAAGASILLVFAVLAVTRGAAEATVARTTGSPLASLKNHHHAAAEHHYSAAPRQHGQGYAWFRKLYPPEVPTESLVAYTRAAWEGHRKADVDSGLRQLSRRRLDDPGILAEVGWLYTEEHRYREGWPLIVQAAALGDQWAQVTVGDTIFLGCGDIDLPASRQLGLAWMRRAAGQCDPDADLFMRIHGHSVPTECSNTADSQSTDTASALVALLESVATSINDRLVTANARLTPRDSGRIWGKAPAHN